MTRANDISQDGPPSEASRQNGDVTPAEERARVRQARESVQDAIGKIIGEPVGEQPGGDAGHDADNGSDDDARKRVSPPVNRRNRIDENGAN